MAQVKDSVNEGNSLAHSLSHHSKLFSDVYINMVRAGEVSGSLDLVLARLADFSEHQEALKGRMRAALAYPVFMFFIGSIILFFLLTFIVPNITQLFTEMQQTLPLPTLILIGVGDFFKAFWWLVLLVLTVGIILVRRLIRLPRGRYLWDELKLRIPVVGGIITKMAMARFGRTLGSLLQSSVPLLSALQIVRNIVNNELIAEVIDKSMVDIQAGQSLATPLSRDRRFPPIVIQMISVGEQSGELENMLHKIADVYERETEAQIMSLTSMLEPVMILIMGIAVGFIVVSILLPIFEMNQMIR
jgi:general secretion pathway protein F